MTSLRRLALVTIAFCAASVPSTSPAIPIVGLTETGRLLAFDSATPGTVILGPTPITGLAAGYLVRGIDFRPATGQLYGLAQSGTLFQLCVLNPATAVATPIGTPIDLGLTANSDDLGFDFNPVVDRVRVVSRDDGNFRLTPDTGALTGNDTAVFFAVGDPNAASNPNVEGLAYTNNVAGAATTTLFAYDYTRDVLARMGGANGTPSPNTGELATIGLSGFSASGTVGFDIAPNGEAFLQDVTRFLTVNLATGAATFVGGFVGTGAMNDIAAVAGPQPRPSVTVKGPATFSVAEATRVLKGRATGAIPPALVEVKVGQKPYRAASGTKRWSRKVRLDKGLNRVTIRTTDLFGSVSRPAKLKITRL